MDTSPPDQAQFTALLKRELGGMKSDENRKFIESKLVQPYLVTLSWEYGSDEPYQAWVFADMQQRDVVAQYCRGGFGSRGAPWGINFRQADHFGMDCGWYPSIEALVEDWGIDA